jgi:hypothetical protein
MNAKMLSKVIEVENRVNTICKCLVLGEANHFTVEYSNSEVCITAYTNQKGRADKLADLMRIYAEPEDILKLRNFAEQERIFWTTELSIAL